MQAFFSIVKREIRGNWAVLAAAGGLILLSAVLLRRDTPIPGWSAQAWQFLLLSTVLSTVQGLVILLIPASLFASEHRAGTLGFLLALPLPRGQLFWAKLAAGVAQVAAIEAGILWVAHLAGVPYPTGSGSVIYDMRWPAGVSTIAAAFAASLLAGIYTRSALLAALYGLLASHILVIAVLWALAPQSQESLQITLGSITAMLGGMAAIALALAYRGVSRLEPRRAA